LLLLVSLHSSTVLSPPPSPLHSSSTDGSHSRYFQRHLRSLLTQEITATYPIVGTPPLKVVRVRSAPSPSESVSPSPRVVCLGSSGSEDEDCRAPYHADAFFYQKMDMIPSWDATAIPNDDKIHVKISLDQMQVRKSVSYDPIRPIKTRDRHRQPVTMCMNSNSVYLHSTFLVMVHQRPLGVTTR
jgi:hypothetical protein